MAHLRPWSLKSLKSPKQTKKCRVKTCQEQPVVTTYTVFGICDMWHVGFRLRSASSHWVQLSNLLCAVAGQVEHLVALGANSATWASWKLAFWVKVRTQKESIYSIKVHFVGQFHSRTRHSSIGREPDPPMLGAPAWSHGPARVDAAVVKFQVWMCSMRRAAVTCLAHLENCSKIYVLYMCT